MILHWAVYHKIRRMFKYKLTYENLFLNLELNAGNLKLIGIDFKV